MTSFYSGLLIFCSFWIGFLLGSHLAFKRAGEIIIERARQKEFERMLQHSIDEFIGRAEQQQAQRFNVRNN
jgi:uncharacterized iron-regulated membrane protein